MNWLTRMLDNLTGGIQRRHEANIAAGIIPPARDSLPVSISEAATIPAVFRALQIIQAAVEQLSIDVERGGVTLTGADVPALVRRPCLDMPRSQFLGYVATSLAATGNAFIMREGGPTATETTQLTPLNPHAVTVWHDKHGVPLFDYDGRTYTSDRIKHLKFLALPGMFRGIGPIQAAQNTMRSARDMNAYSAQWWETGQPSGVLTSNDRLTPDDARQYRNLWNQLDEDGNPLTQTDNPSRIRVLGKGLHYEPILISPKDAMWIEAQQFDTLDIARIFGVPSSLMLTAIDGNSMTYSNVEQEWLGFIRFTLSSYTRKIEEALTELAPRGQTVRFNFEALLRADTSSRYAAHEIAIRAGFMTIDEVRAIENLPPLGITKPIEELTA